MTEEENYTNIDISDIVEDTEPYADTDNPNSEIMVYETDTHSELHADVDLGPELITISTEDQLLVDRITQNQNKVQKSEVVKNSHAPKLAMGRIKNIMKMDPDVNIVQQDAVFLVTKATEMFLETLANETYSYLPKNKKTINKKELDLAINRVDSLCFLEGAMDF
ncbi:DNA polymerase epsilon subunit 4 [Pectinophora gossypiella]|uniref:DNA polymerase epsilon subunit 4 n=1 Tax=Pectinophora gossypiella TaxID=13191 RepID=UPI00214E7F94|nr:DNA polymerase epsilon subunit 4 [Pectinophora gossypiella]